MLVYNFMMCVGDPVARASCEATVNSTSVAFVLESIFNESSLTVSVCPPAKVSI